MMMPKINSFNQHLRHLDWWITLIMAAEICIVLLFYYHGYQSIVKENTVQMMTIATESLGNMIENELARPIAGLQVISGDTRLQNSLAAGADAQALQALLTPLGQRQGFQGFQYIPANQAQTATLGPVPPPASLSQAQHQLLVDHTKTMALTSADDGYIWMTCPIKAGDLTTIGVLSAAWPTGDLTEKLQAALKDGTQALLLDQNGQSILFTSAAVPAWLPQDITADKAVYWQSHDQLKHCLIVQPLPFSGWSLVLDKDVTPLHQAFMERMLRDLTLLALVLILAALLILRLIQKERSKLESLFYNDPSMELYGRYGYYQRLKQEISAGEPLLVFMMTVEPSWGQDDCSLAYSEEILHKIALQTQQALGPAAILARWNADRFSGFLPTSEENIWRIRRLSRQLSEALGPDGPQLDITVGYTKTHPDDLPQDVIQRAVNALEHSRRQKTWPREVPSISCALQERKG